MPQWKLRPPNAPGPTESTSLISVLVDSARSAEPPTSSGTAGAIALITLPLAARVAIGPSAAANVGTLASQPVGSSPMIWRHSSAASSGCACA